jgi:hypothetical protein
MTDDERMINSLENALSKKIDDARRAQEALTAARRRLGLCDPQQFFTSDEMDAERAAARVEMREIVSAAIADTRYRFDPKYKPDAMHRALIELGASFRDEAKRATAATGNVVPLPRGQTAQQIIAAGKRRRGET